MNTMQRILMMLTAFFLLIMIPISFRLYRRELARYQSAEWLLEELTVRLCRKGECTYSDYLCCVEALAKLDGSRKLQIYAYQREEGRDNRVHWYFVSWEEIREKLMSEQIYHFQDGGADRKSVV